MTRIGGEDQFMRNFEQSTVVTPADQAQAESGAASSKSGGVGASEGSGNVTGGTQTVSNENLSELYLVAMETAYNSQATDMINKSDQMQTQNQQATDMSQAENAVTSAQLNANGGSISIVVVPDSEGPATADGSTAYITESEAEMMDQNGLTVTSGEVVSGDDISSLSASMNDIQQNLAGNSEYTLLELQMDTQNMQQDSSLATSGLKTIGDAQSSVAQNA
jgi:hypothetical protein